MAIDQYALSPGGEINPALSSSFPTGGTTEATTSETFSSLGSLNGTVFSSVIKNDSSNPYGGLTFTYLINLTGATGSDAAFELTVGSYSGFSTDVSYKGGSGIAPTTFSRNNVLGGDVLQFQWTGSSELTAGDISALVVVQTDASNYGITSGALLLDSGGLDLNNLYAPSTAVPEATGTVGLLALGVSVLFVFRRRIGSRELVPVSVVQTSGTPASKL